MIKFIDGRMLYILYGERSYFKYNKLLVAKLLEKFGEGKFDQESVTHEILKFAYAWSADTFLELMHSQKDVRFLYYLFKVHEDSIKLYYHSQTDAAALEKKEVHISTLSVNRRILKLALEQACDIDYTGNIDPDPSVMPGFLMRMEDLLFVGERLFAFAEYMAEQRMMEDPIEIIIEKNAYTIQRKYHYDAIYGDMEKLFQEGFSSGLVDKDSVKELREELQKCMGIDYDFAGGQIKEIKKHFSPVAPDMQTVQYEALLINLQHNGVSVEDSENFYAGLTLSRTNKLPIQKSVYLSHSFKRYFFRPILMVNINGEERALVGDEKWKESILVMATNGFQWQHAPDEWKRNQAFKKYLDRKSEEHDKILEDKVKEVLNARGIPFIHHVVQLSPLKGPATRIDKEPGEIDFIIVDLNCKKILVTDCKYHRARYEMVGFSTDFKNFREEYEPKIIKKVKFTKDHLPLLQEHFEREAKISFDLTLFDVDALFIVNTPTFYILNGRIKTVTITHLDELIDNCYIVPEIVANLEDGSQKAIKHPYYTIQ